MNLILIDCDPGYAPVWNRWYDTDHLAEFLALEGVVAARRYVAPPDLQPTRDGAAEEGLSAGSAAYCTMVFVGPDERAAAIGRAGMAATHNRLIDVDGRMPDWARITPRYIEGFDVAAVSGADAVPVTADALLHLAHRAVLVELFDSRDQPATEAWLDGVHIPHLLAQAGVAAAARFRPAPLPAVEAPWAGDGADGPSADAVRLLLVLVLDADPAQVAGALRACSDGTVAARDGVNGERRALHGIYRGIQGLDYAFVDQMA
jgi:hypothetical protein